MQKPSIPKGTRDFSPEEMAKRNYIFNTIREVYHLYGFQQIETPAMENLSTLMGKYGEEGDKLLFKILNSGDCFSGITDEELSERNAVRFGMKACEKGLRYDLTVPLVRFYANHANELPSPFKALQIGNVWRADRPQRGRYRQFMQCDIDILGEPSNLAEIELILATTTTLGRLGFQDFVIRINERRILKAMAAYSGFAEEDYDTVFIILDKMDKIGADGVKAELVESGFAAEAADKYMSLFDELTANGNSVAWLAEKLGDFLEPEVSQNLSEIIDSVRATKASEFEITFDPTLVRGMSYYTGTIFEIAIPQFGGSCGGGGRYDKMVGKFTGKDVPACGFSIGFERIILLMMENGFQIPGQPKKIAYLIEKGVSGDRLCEVIAQAQEARKNGDQILVARMNKNKKFQKEQLTKEGYTDFVEFYKNPIEKQ